MVVNGRWKRCVELHDALNGFRKGGVTVTANLKAKMAQHMARLSHEPIFQVFLDDRKAYGSLGRVRCLKIMRGYGMGPKLARPLTHYWGWQRIVPKSVNFM